MGREILSRSQLKRLAEHKYSVTGVSLMEPLMQRFWKWIVLQIPESWAPNAMTLAGLIINVVTTAILMFYSPDARQQVSCCLLVTHTHTQPFSGLLSGTTRVGRYQKKHSPTHTHPDHRTSFVTFLHLQRSMACCLLVRRT